MAQSKNVAETTDATFAGDVGQGLTLVDFWAEWCGPCRLLGPIVEGLADEYAGKMRVLKVNVDNNQETAARFHIRSIPTMIFFKNGQAVDQLVGNLPKEEIQKTIQKHLG